MLQDSQMSVSFCKRKDRCACLRYSFSMCSSATQFNSRPLMDHLGSFPKEIGYYNKRLVLLHQAVIICSRDRKSFLGALKKNTHTHLQHPRPKYVTLLYVPLSLKHHVSFPLFTERARTRATMYYRSRRSPFPFLKCRQVKATVKRRRLGKPEKAI